MSVQTNYSFFASKGAAGGIVDLAPYAIDTFTNEEEYGKLKFGVGVVKGSIPGKTIKLPSDGVTAANFEGVATNNRTTEFDSEGKLAVRKNAAVGVMRYGRIYVRVAAGAAPAYGDSVYLVTSGDEAGFFTNTADSVAIKGRFIGPVDTNAQVAPVELFNQQQA